MPDYAWALINRLRDVSDFQRLALVRQIQAALGLAHEDDLSLVEALKQEGLIRL